MRAKAAGQSILLLLDVIEVLNRQNIPYAVIGALAVSYYGTIRASVDADAVISLLGQGAALDRLKTALGGEGLNVIFRPGDAEDPLLGMLLVEDVFGNRVDLVLGIRGMDPGVYQRSNSTRFQGETMNIAGVEDLLAMKVFAGSAKDLDDVRGILQVSAELIDRKLLQRLASAFGRQAQKRLKGLLNQ